LQASPKTLLKYLFFYQYSNITDAQEVTNYIEAQEAANYTEAQEFGGTTKSKEVTNRNEVRTSIANGGWTIVWGDLLNEFDVLTFAISIPTATIGG
jgi:hypothetical protein